MLDFSELLNFGLPASDVILRDLELAFPNAFDKFDEKRRGHLILLICYVVLAGLLATQFTWLTFEKQTCEDHVTCHRKNHCRVLSQVLYAAHWAGRT